MTPSDLARAHGASWAGQLTDDEIRKADAMKMETRDYAEDPQAKRARLAGIIRMTKTMARDVNRAPGIQAAAVYLAAKRHRNLTRLAVVQMFMLAGLAGVAVAAWVRL